MTANKIVHFSGICFVLVVLIVLQVYLLNNYSTIGQQLSDLHQEIEMVESQNLRLQTEVASASAMLSIWAQSEMVGLIKIPVTVSLKAPLPVAYGIHQSL